MLVISTWGGCCCYLYFVYKRREASRMDLQLKANGAGKSQSQIHKKAEAGSVHLLTRPPETPEKSERQEPVANSLVCQLSNDRQGGQASFPGWSSGRTCCFIFMGREREMLLQRSTSQVNPLSWYQKEGGNEHGLSVLLQVLKEDGIRRWEPG